MHSDGSFDFADVPPGRYAADLRLRPVLVLTEHSIEVADQSISGITLASAPTLTPVQVQVNADGGHAGGFRMSVVLKSSSEVPIPAEVWTEALAPPGFRLAIDTLLPSLNSLRATS